jgi:hypothetical protein
VSQALEFPSTLFETGGSIEPRVGENSTFFPDFSSRSEGFFDILLFTIQVSVMVISPKLGSAVVIDEENKIKKSDGMLRIEYIVGVVDDLRPVD